MKIDLNHFRFHSSDHVRYQSGRAASGHNKGNNRGIEVVKHPTIPNAYKVSICNLDGNHPIWGDKFQMAPKVMKIVNDTDNLITLRGFGYDAMGAPFSDYGLSIYLNTNTVHKVKLHMFDREVEIEYYQ